MISQETQDVHLISKQGLSWTDIILTKDQTCRAILPFDTYFLFGLNKSIVKYHSLVNVGSVTLAHNVSSLVRVNKDAIIAGTD
jgi:hypothetical protein